MTETCLLANTGADKYALLALTASLFVASIAIYSVYVCAGKQKTYGKFMIVMGVFILGFVFTMTQAVSAGAVAEECITTRSTSSESQNNSSSRAWSPEGRFQSLVFEPTDIVTEEDVNFGTETNFAGNPESLLMTINRPNQSIDFEEKRPLIIAFPGGDNAGFCDQTFAKEQEAMLELARYGYVTVTVTQLVDPAFCDGEPGQSYLDNMIINLNVLNKATQYMYDNADQYSIDPENTALYGYSIGGQIALLKVREDYNDAPRVKAIAGFAAIASPDFNSALSDIVGPINDRPAILMVSFEPDTGFGGGVVPDARGDCENLVNLGYDCTFGGMPFPSHPVHANDGAPLYMIQPENIPVDERFRDFMYTHLVENL